MKISPISTVKIDKTSINKKITNPVLADNKQYDANKMHGIYFGKDLVSKKEADFQRTVAKNYFHLKPGLYPDNFQLEAGRNILKGNDVLAEAPTGIGKTALAYYAASKNLAEGKKTFYTTPIKALSNQKLLEFQEIFGKENVGILTGDRKENADAPIVIMTTEVYRNMIVSDSYKHNNRLLEDLGSVILDEFHYLGDESRGPVWEESVMFSPKDTQLVMLSATIGNSKELTNWVGDIRGNKTNLVRVAPENRPVPLKFDSLETQTYSDVRRRAAKALRKNKPQTPELQQYITETEEKHQTPTLRDYLSAVIKLKDKDQLPAIFFVFSRNSGRNIISHFEEEGHDLTTDEDKREIRRTIDEFQKKYYLGEDFNEKALLKGYAIHNAGVMPRYKELVENLFQRKLIKVVISTETLGAGINMPARTVVLSSPYKPCESFDKTKNKGDEFEVEEEIIERDNILDSEGKGRNKSVSNSKVYSRRLTSNEFKQMAGRAGRRGIDEIGYVYTMPVSYSTDEAFAELEAAPSDSISSKYDPTYSFLCEYYSNCSDKEHLDKVFEKSLFVHEPLAAGKICPRLNEGSKQIYLNNGTLEYADDDKKSLVVSKKGKVDYISLYSFALTNVLKEYGFIEETEDFGYRSTTKGKMAAKICGYEPIPIIETIAHNKSFKNLTPETLVMVAATIANPSNRVLEKFKVDGRKLAVESYESSEAIKSSLRTELRRDLSTMLRDLGKTFDDFDSYADMLKYAEGLESVDVDMDELRDEIPEIDRIRSTLYQIDKKGSNYQLDDIYEALKEETVVPSKALNKWKENIREFKKLKSIVSFEDYIEKLKKQIQTLENSSKAKKAKARNEKEIQQIRSEITKAKKYQYIEENIQEALNSNADFKRRYNMASVQERVTKVMGAYTQNELKDKMIKSIQALMSMEEVEEYDEYAVSEMTYRTDRIFSSLNLVSQILFAEEGICGLEGKMPLYNTDAGKIVHNWAALNKVSPDGVANWQSVVKAAKDEYSRQQELCDNYWREKKENKDKKDEYDISAGKLVAVYDGTEGAKNAQEEKTPDNKLQKDAVPIRPYQYDEGSMFRMVMQTGDFLGQIKDVAKVGYENSKTEEDRQYYKDLMQKAQEARELIIKEPLV